MIELKTTTTITELPLINQQSPKLSELKNNIILENKTKNINIEIEIKEYKGRRRFYQMEIMIRGDRDKTNNGERAVEGSCRGVGKGRISDYV